MSNPETPDKPQAAPKEADPVREANLERCLTCRHADQKNPQQGTLLCKHHKMFVNAADDEIPDDCKEYEP